MPKSAKTRKSQKGWCNKPTKLQFQWILNTENSMLSKRYESANLNLATCALGENKTGVCFLVETIGESCTLGDPRRGTLHRP